MNNNLNTNKKSNTILSSFIIFILTIISLMSCFCFIPFSSLFIKKDMTIAYFFSMEIATFFFLLLLFFIVVYRKENKKRKKSFSINAIVLDDIGFERLSTGRLRYNKTPMYRIGFYINNEYIEKDAKLKLYNLKQGQQILVKCYYNDENEIEVLSDAEISWALEMIITYSILIISILTIMFFCIIK